MAKVQTEKETLEEKPLADKVDLSTEESKKPSQEGAKSITQKEQVLYLFGRTGREKEEWFRRFLLASKLKSEGKKPISVCGNKPGRTLFLHTTILRLTCSKLFKCQLLNNLLEDAMGKKEYAYTAF